ncbi:MAG TPA: OmpA family protein [Stellaceae bacterium]|nr:OmpA family protein [Stellaceae bacterium]
MRIGRVAAAALASCFVGWTGAQAQSIQLDGPYVRIEGGWNHLEDLTFTGSHGLAGTENNAEGFIIGGALGYKMGPWHFEINTDYRNNGVDGLSLTNPGVLPVASGSQFGHAGNVTSLADMINATYDLPWMPMANLTPYVGAGVGAAIVRLNSITGNAGAPISAPNTNDAVPAIQGIVGLRYDFDPVRSISLEYRFINGFSPSFKDSSNGTLNTSDYQSHSIMVALTWSLGAVAAPPPPPAPAAAEAPPPPPPPAGARNEFIVYFDFDKSSLTAAARQILDEAAAAYMQNKTVKISVTGYTDTVGTAAYNLALSVRRADSVRNYLRGKGVPVDAMDVQGKGKTDLRVPTPDGVREPQNRRVEIIMP